MFINRRGYAPITLCRACGHQVGCDDCDARMVEHRFLKRLVCHQCGATKPMPVVCPACGVEGRMAAVGPGVERLAEEVAALFPQTRIAVLSSDLFGSARALKEQIALIAEGDSMIGDRIHSGDVVFLRSQDHVQDGEIAAVALDNEVTLKHVRRLRGPDGNIAFTQLLPSNPAYAPIDIGGEGETRMVRILGKAVAVRFML